MGLLDRIEGQKKQQIPTAETVNAVEETAPAVETAEIK